MSSIGVKIAQFSSQMRADDGHEAATIQLQPVGFRSEDSFLARLSERLMSEVKFGQLIDWSGR